MASAAAQFFSMAGAAMAVAAALPSADPPVMLRAGVRIARDGIRLTLIESAPADPPLRGKIVYSEWRSASEGRPKLVDSAKALLSEVQMGIRCWDDRVRKVDRGWAFLAVEADLKGGPFDAAIVPALQKSGVSPALLSTSKSIGNVLKNVLQDEDPFDATVVHVDWNAATIGWLMDKDGKPDLRTKIVGWGGDFHDRLSVFVNGQGVLVNRRTTLFVGPAVEAVVWSAKSQKQLSEANSGKAAFALRPADWKQLFANPETPQGSDLGPDARGWRKDCRPFEAKRLRTGVEMLRAAAEAFKCVDSDKGRLVFLGAHMWLWEEEL